MGFDSNSVSMRLMQLKRLLELLGYSGAENYRTVDGYHEPSTAHIFRAAGRAGDDGARVDGAYVFHTSFEDKVLPVRPAVYVAEALSTDQARSIHRSLWNLGSAPFLIVLLPNQIRIYTGFDYDHQDDSKGFIDSIELTPDLLSNLDQAVISKLTDFSAESIDTGRIWESKAQELKTERRVDVRLLRNLTALEKRLVEESDSPPAEILPIAHALIGKYVYIRYLRDRGILSEQWLAGEGIRLDIVLGRDATLTELKKLIEALERRFNGAVFPFPQGAMRLLNDRVVSSVASTFKGDDPRSGQLALEFQSYDFSYIPVETLSAIYEQFLRAQGEGKRVGAVYTPEPLADYLLSEINYAKPLKRGMRVLDPCCGSGIFLVLAYRRLIETELLTKPDGKLLPTELRRILLESLYGVERNLDACYVTEFSLILTMLNYIDPPELHRNRQFKFPELHNKRIFQSDFFDTRSLFCEEGQCFDWVVGNPPWTEPSADSEDERLVLKWIEAHRSEHPVAGNKVSEACSWRAVDFLAEGGCVGFLLHAKTLFNHESKSFRQAFFGQHQVVRITNFSNLAYILFEGRGEAPAITIIYRRANEGQPKPPVLHCGPFVINQVAYKSRQKRSKRRTTWTITLNEDEIQTIEHDEAEDGESTTWKLALWGSSRDKRAIGRLRKVFKTTLGDLVDSRRWDFSQGLSLQNAPTSTEEFQKVVSVPELAGMNSLDADVMIKSGHRFSIPSSALSEVPPGKCFIRKRGGNAGLKIARAPHLVVNVGYCLFSDEDFVIPHPITGLSGSVEDADYLRALSVFLSSSISRYYLFFVSPAWGIDRNAVYPKDIRSIPVPVFSPSQVQELVLLQKEVAKREILTPEDSLSLQASLDAKVESLFKVPRSISTLAKDLLQLRLTLNKGKTTGRAVESPSEGDLRVYAQYLKSELDEYTASHNVHHKVSLNYSPDFIACTVSPTREKSSAVIEIEKADESTAESHKELANTLKEQFSQWVYVQRGLRVFDRATFRIYKAPRLIDWTRTQALLDSEDIIAEVIATQTKIYNAQPNETSIT